MGLKIKIYGFSEKGMEFSGQSRNLKLRRLRNKIYERIIKERGKFVIKKNYAQKTRIYFLEEIAPDGFCDIFIEVLAHKRSFNEREISDMVKLLKEEVEKFFKKNNLKEDDQKIEIAVPSCRIY